MNREVEDDVTPDSVHDSAALPAGSESTAPHVDMRYLHETCPETMDGPRAVGLCTFQYKGQSKSSKCVD